MGFTLPGIIAKIFIKNLEQELQKHFLESKTIYYIIFVDNVFIIYNKKILMESILEDFNKQHKGHYNSQPLKKINKYHIYA
jgi:hypothetical protein